MRKILIIGAGKSSSYLIKYLVDKAITENLKITIGDINVENATKLLEKDAQNVEVIHLDVFDSKSREEAIKSADIVISMFVCGSLDCLEISQRLARAGFTGRYYVLVPDLPDPQIIIDEITQSCPEIDIQIVTSPAAIKEASQ